jgi:tetratricopeptide (TPR) repeat protein
MDALENQVNIAFSHHTAGRLAEAESLYRNILTAYPNDISTNYLLGSLKLQQDQLVEAKSLLSLAIELAPQHIQARSNLGVTMHQLGNSQAALVQYDYLVSNGHGTPDIWNNRGTLLLEMKCFEQAAVSFEQALVQHPEFIEAMNNLGVAHQQLGNIDTAIESFKKALQLQPDHFDAANNLGVLYCQEKKYTEGEEFLKKAIQIAPFSAKPRVAWAKALAKKDDIHEALKLIKEALKFSPNQVETLYTYSNILRDSGKFAESSILEFRIRDFEGEKNSALILLAISHLIGGLSEKAKEYIEQVGTLNPNFVTNRGTVSGWAAMRDNKLDEAVHYLNQAIDLNPEDGAAHWNKALALLMDGRLEEGWKEFDWRFHPSAPVGPHGYTKPEWTGEPLNGRSILIHGMEQGVGDIFQFMRYVKYVEQKGGRILFAAQQPVFNLLSEAPAQGSSSIDPQSDNVAPINLEYEVQIPLLSLPKVLGTDSVEKIPYDGPYVEADTALAEVWAKKIAAPNKFKVGIVWAGNPKHKNDNNRSTMLEDFAPLAKIPGVQFYSIQKGVVEVELSSPPDGFAIHSLSDGIKDFSDTAAVIANLDLVISVDTSVVHLAGAMGRPVWTLLPYNPDWRWLLNRDDTPWYPSMKLFRQKIRGEWSPVFSEVAVALLEYVASKEHEIAFNELDRQLIDAAMMAQQGKLDLAWAIYRKLLQQAECQNSALFQQVVHFSEKYNYIQQVIVALQDLLNLENNNEWLLHGYAKLLIKNKQALDAEPLLRSLVEQKKDFLPAYMLLGYLLHEQNRFADAITVLEKAKDLFPEHLNIQYQLGRTNQRLGQREAAMQLYKQVISEIPRHDKARNNLAVALEEADLLDEALEQLQVALRYAPNHLFAWSNLGRVLLAKSELEIAETCLARAIEINPGLAEAHYAMGGVHLAKERYQEALVEFQQAVTINPKMADVYAAMTIPYWRLGDKVQAEIARAKAKEIDSENRHADINMAWCYLPKGDLKNGFPAYEARLKSVGEKRLKPDSPRWSGEPIGNKKLLVFAEQGFGDSIQFIRFMPLLGEVEVLFVCQDGLESLLAKCSGVKTVIAKSVFESKPVAHDMHIQLMSLPLMLGVDDVWKIPAEVPYIFADANKLAEWEKRFAQISQQVKVGLVWSGNPKHKGDKERSISLRHFVTLSEVAGIDFFSLQKGERVFEGNEYGAQLGLHDLDGDLTDWEQTAAAIMCLDLVITVDTAVAHLAGALGKPVWVLIPKIADWRWIEGMETSPWYPSMRIFRQTEAGNWLDVMQRVKSSLGQWVQLRAKSLG